MARDLHLKHIFGGESLEVPVTINNELATRFKGVVKVEVFLSTTTDLSGSATGNRAVMTKMENLDLAGNGTKDLKITFTVTPHLPGLVAGRDYYIVVKTTPVVGGDSNESNDVVASSESFRFLGTPTYMNLFTTTAYFDLIRETLRDDTAAAREQSATVNVSDLKSFVAAFEGSRASAYLDSEGIPTIGIGINLNSISGTLKSEVADAVRAYYLANYPRENIATKTDDQIILMLRVQALTNQRKAVLTDADIDSLFETTIARFETMIDGLGLGLSTRQRIAMIDLAYNVGSPFPGVVSALRQGDVVLAGFQLFDARRTTQAPGLRVRTRAEYANLLSGHKSLLGNLV
jgi:GH24 family phage-related lysozyme (muramidase)